MTTLNPKDPGDLVDYAVVMQGDGFEGETIATVVGTGEGIDLENSPPMTWTADTITFWVSGGVLGADGKVQLEITTQTGRLFQRTIVIPIRDL